MRSPAVRSMSSSRPEGSGATSVARSTSSSVVSPIAETTTTTSLPALRVSTMRLATRLMLTASATEDPPYFCTISAMGLLERMWAESEFYPSSALYYAAPLEGAAQRDLVGVLEVAADREA